MSTFKATNSVAVAINFFFTLLLPYLQEKFGYGHFLTQMEALDEYLVESPFSDHRSMRSRKRDIKINNVITITLEENRSGDWIPIKAVYSDHEDIVAFPCKNSRLELENFVPRNCANIDDFEMLCQQAIPPHILPALSNVWRNLIADVCYKIVRRDR